MLTPKEIVNYKKQAQSQHHGFEQQMQEDDLSYLSSQSFEKFNVSDSEIEALKNRIDKKTTKGNSNSFQTIFISVLCGLLIGISIFFVIFHKNQTHPSVYQDLSEKQTEQTLHNTINATDTLFPETKGLVTESKKEHFNSNEEFIENVSVAEVPDMLPIKTPSLSVEENEEELKFQFIPNAPVIFISGLKVTNYKSYYFKRNDAINLLTNTGVEAQYESAANMQTNEIATSNKYYAHKIIRKAMQLFNDKHFANCIEELNLLYNYNNYDANTQFYLGMCYYQTGKYAIAQNFFQKNLDNENNIFHQEAEFYQALCWMNTNQTDKAIQQLKTIENNKGFYSIRAQELLQKHGS